MGDHLATLDVKNESQYGYVLEAGVNDILKVMDRYSMMSRM